MKWNRLRETLRARVKTLRQHVGTPERYWAWERDLLEMKTIASVLRTMKLEDAANRQE